MSRIKPRRRPPLLKSLPWFLPALIAVALAGWSTHPVVLIPLLLANALAMGAVCHAIGFDPEPSFARTLLRRGAAHMVMFTSYTAVMFLLVAWPLVRLIQEPSLSGALLLAAALVVALASLWRIWPAFGLVFVWDDAYPGQEDGSWIFTAVARSIAFGRHLSAEERFFSHFLPAAMALLVLSFAAVTLTGLYGVLPSELRISALAIYGLVLLPLGCMVIANRTLRAMLCEGRQRPHGTPASRSGVTATAPLTASADKTPRVDPVFGTESAPGPVQPPHSIESIPAGRPQAELDNDLLEATRGGDVDRALALLDAGADANTTAHPGDRDQRPVLVLAALMPDVRLLRALITRGAEVNRVHAGCTALLAASRDSWHGRADAVMTLLANGANASAVDGEGNTALHGAVLCGEPTIAAMLLDAGAPLNALNKAGYSALAAACRAANWNLTRFLLERGAKATPVDGEPALVAAAGITEDDDEGVRILFKHRAAVNATDSHGRSALMVAAAEGHERICRTLRGAGADVGLADRRGSTALMEASRAGAPRIVELFAEATPDPRARDSHGRDALTLACQSPQARAETVRALLALGAQPREAGMDGRSALDHAAAAGRWDLVALLDPETPLPASMSDAVVPEAGADSPDHLLDALRFGHWAVASTFARRAREWPASQLAAMYFELSAPGLGASRAWLLEHGLDAEARLGAPRQRDDKDIENGDDDSTKALGRRLFDALIPQLPASQDAVAQLLDAGATPAGAGLFLQAVAHMGDSDAEASLLLRMLGAGADPFGVDARLRSAVHVAAAVAHPRVLNELLARGGDPNARDGQGRTPLFAALEAGNRVLERVRSLVAHGADPETTDAHGETPLGVAMGQPEVERWLSWSRWPLPRRPLRATDLPQAAASGDAEAVRRLLDLGFAVDAADDKGATALLRACGAGHRDVAVVVLDAGADPERAASTGATPLVAAVTARRENLVALLLERGVAVDQRLPGETTATMIAAALGYPEIVEALVDAGADINARDGSGHTPLHAAAQYCFESSDSLRSRRLLDVLISRKAEINHADNEGKTALLLLLGAHKRPGVSCDATHLGALLPALLDAGADISHADQRGVTGLHACAMHALLPPARTLMARGADRSAADAFGRTAGDVARTLGLVDIAHELGVRTSAVPSVRQTLRQPSQPND
ncbi:ankyrin repeat domain-containing protein [Pinirhizobacter sp.]|jgi:hypothetical protein|uniref:ankyrin repeat domain-containing protein n=1 Tax=Pinirhizobacter sp. TaxID=2950432 RepID=UPI002F40EEF0